MAMPSFWNRSPFTSFCRKIPCCRSPYRVAEVVVGDTKRELCLFLDPVAAPVTGRVMDDAEGVPEEGERNDMSRSSTVLVSRYRPPENLRSVDDNGRREPSTIEQARTRFILPPIVLASPMRETKHKPSRAIQLRSCAQNSLPSITPLNSHYLSLPCPSGFPDFLFLVHVT